MNIKRSRSAAIGVFLLLAAMASAHAQIIWGLPSSITGASDVSTSGTLFDAMEADTNDSSAQTVNTVTFNRDPGATDGKITLSAQGAGTGGSASTSSPEYNALLTGNEYVRGAGVFGTITIGKTGNLLKPGDTYQIEVWDTAYTSTFSAGSGGVGSATSPVTVNNQYVIGTFVAGPTGIETLTWTTPGTSYASLTAIEVRDVPEPTSWGLILIGGLLFTFLWRFRPGQVNG